MTARTDDHDDLPASGGRALPVLFGVTSFVASGLIFVVEPLVARTMLPVLGGSASVWNSAMVTFQLLLLGGYVLAHLAATRLSPTWHPPVMVGLAIVAIVALPVGLRAGWQPADENPAFWTIAAVGAAVGIPFLALACVSPTLQRWYGSIRPEVNPYVLYSAGNAGSFVGLLAYPLVIDRVLGMSSQRTLWSGAYGLFFVLFASCAFLAWRVSSRNRDLAVDPPVDADLPTPGGLVVPVPVPVTSRMFLRWAAMAAGPSLLLLGVTRHLATDVAAVPMLWVLPLSLYLLTFVVAFSSAGPRFVGPAERVGLLLAGVVMVSLVITLPGVFGVAIHLVAFTALVMATHGRLVALRPGLDGLTAFYVALSVGGAVGGLVGGLLAPLAFSSILEYPLGLLACVVWLVPTLALPSRVRPVALGAIGVLVVGALALRLGSIGAATDGPPRVLLIVLGLVVLAGFMWAERGWQLTVAFAAVALIAIAVPDPNQIVQKRTYYGVTRVLENQAGWHLLISGTTVHGSQDPKRPREPLEYYAEGGPMSDAVKLAGGATPRSIGAVGLGAGSMAGWTKKGDEIVFYEIDPAVISVASDSETFSFLADARGSVELQEGDGRLLLAEPEARGRHDILFIDAFSSDSIPVHLVTREALAAYRRAITPDGVIVFHVSNRYFDLAPVVTRLADDASLDSLVRVGKGSIDGSSLSTAVAVGSTRSLARLAASPGWHHIEPAASLWTDDRSDVLGALLAF